MYKAMANSEWSQAVSHPFTDSIICFIMTNQNTNFLKSNFLKETEYSKEDMISKMYYLGGKFN